MAASIQSALSGAVETQRDDEHRDALRHAAALGVNVALHVVGLVLAAAAMRPGTPAASPRRAHRLPRRRGRAGWTLGWLAWMACARSRSPRSCCCSRARVPSPLTRGGAVLAMVGAVVDIACDVAYAWVLPARAAADVAGFVVLRAPPRPAEPDRRQRPLLARRPRLHARPPATARWRARGLGVLTFVGGMVLAGAGLTGDPRHVMVGTAVTITSFMAWTLAVSSSRHR